MKYPYVRIQVLVSSVTMTGVWANYFLSREIITEKIKISNKKTD